MEHYDDSSSYDGGGIEETADDWLNEDAPGEDDYDFFDDGSGRSRTRTAEDYFGPEIGDYVADIVAEQFGQAVPDSRDPRVELAGRMLDEQDAEAYQQEAIQVRDAAFVDLEHRFPEIAEPGVAAQVLDAAVQAVREAGRPELVDHPAFADVVERVFTSRSVSEWTADIDQDRMVKKLEDRPGSWF